MSNLDTLKKVRFKLLIEHVFFGSLLQGIPLKIDNSCSSAYTTGKVIAFADKFVEELTINQILFVIAHELLHIVYEHTNKTRATGKDKSLWNVACDYRINYDLVKGKIGEMPEKCLYHEKYDDTWTSEAIYKDLLENGDPNGYDLSKFQGFDFHDFWESLSPEEQEEVKRQVIKAYHEAKSSNPGSIPGGVERQYKELLNPKVPWQDLITSTVISYRKADKNWSRFNRRYLQRGTYLPWYSNGTKANFAIAYDLSGSIGSEEISIMVGETVEAMNLLDDFDLTLIGFDTEVTCCTHYQKGDTFDFQLKGGGGSSAKCVTNYMEEREICVDHLFVITDGYLSSWPSDEECEVTYIMTTDAVAPNGETIRYDD